MIPPKGISCDFSWRTNCCDLNRGQKAGTAPLGRLKQSQVVLQSITFINHGSFSPFRWGSPAHHGRMFWRRRTKVIFCNYQLLWPVPPLMPFIYKTMEKKKSVPTNGMKYNPRGSRCRTAASLRVSVYLSEAASLTRCRARKTGQLKQMISEKRGDTFIAVGCTKTNISLIYAVFFIFLFNKQMQMKEQKMSGNTQKTCNLQ